MRVLVNGDTVDEGDETFLVSFRHPTNAKLGGYLGLGYGIIVDDEPGVKVRPGLATTEEGDRGTKTVDIPVTLSAASTSAVTVSWTAAPGSATTPADFVGASGTLTFAPGETQKTVSVVVNGDEIDEPDEFIVLKLSNPGNAKLGGWLGLGFGIIEDNDT